MLYKYKYAICDVKLKRVVKLEINIYIVPSTKYDTINNHHETIENTYPCSLLISVNETNVMISYGIITIGIQI